MTARNRDVLFPLKNLIGHKLYRALSRPAAVMLRQTPTGVKYGRRAKMPYSVIQPGDVVVQVGAPRDLVDVGRSRSVYFLRLVGPTGRLIGFKPDIETKIPVTSIDDDLPSAIRRCRGL